TPAKRTPLPQDDLPEHHMHYCNRSNWFSNRRTLQGRQDRCKRGALRWSVICAKPPATTTLEWIEHYHGETIDGEVNNQTTWPDNLYEKRNSLHGRYRGPCAAK